MFSSPIFFVLIAFFCLYGIYKAIVPYSKKDEQKILRKFLSHLKDKSQTSDSKTEQEAFSTVVKSIEKEGLGDITSTAAPAYDHLTESLDTNSVRPKTPFAQKPIDFTPAFHSLENINILLYLGAFFLIVACSLFASYSYEFLDGFSKTLLLFFFSCLFYFSGLALYTRTQKVKPAGITFTAIGLLSQPLVGLAAYNFLFTPTDVYIVSLFTSVFCFISYCIAYYFVRKSFLSYLMSFSIISITLSLMKVMDVPYYYISEAMCLTALCFFLFSKHKEGSEELKEPFYLTSQVLLPITLLLSLGFVEIYEVYFHTGINLLIGSLFYFVTYLFSATSKNRPNYLMAGLVLLPISVSFLYRDTVATFFSAQIAFILAFIALLYLACMEYFLLKKKQAHAEVFGIIAGLSSTILLFLVPIYPFYFLGFTMFSVVINAYVTQRLRSILTHLLGSVGYLLIPFALSMYFKFDFASAYTSLMYSLICLLLLAKKFLYREKKDFADVSALSLIASFGLSFFLALSEFSTVTIITYVALILFVSLVSYTEKIPEVIGLSVLIIYLLAFRFLTQYDASLTIFTITYIVLGLTTYASANVFDPTRKKILQTFGILGIFAGPAYDFSLENGLPIQQFAVLVGALVIFFESMIAQSKTGQRFAAALGIAAVQWFTFSTLEIREVHFYALMWSGYFACLAYIENDQNREGCTFIALAFATFPIGLKGLESEPHGLFLMVQSFFTILLGIYLKNKHVIYWSFAVLVLEVLYYMREFLYNIPGWVVFGVAGIVILVGATYLLTKRKEE